MKAIHISLVLASFMLAFSCCANPEEPVEELPILAWYSIVGEGNDNLERYMELKDCGFNWSFPHTYDFESAVRALDMCAEVGIKSVFMCPELSSNPEGTVMKVKDHPGLGAYFLRDEPGSVEDLKSIGEWADRIKAVDSSHACYLNLLPSWVFQHDDYVRHLRDFDEIVDIPLISFDQYPVLMDENGTVSVRSLWYDNLEMVSAESARTGKPFWAFALSTAHGPYPVPTPGHLRLQMYSNLAYGAQGLQYFTYWSPGTDRWDFHNAPINHGLKRSSMYEMVRELNLEIQRRAFVFVGSKVQGVFHMGESIPQGTRRLETLPDHFTELDSNGAPALVSTLRKGDRTYVVVVNTSPVDELMVRMATDGCVGRVRLDGSVVKSCLYDPLYRIPAGSAEIFTYTDGCDE